MDFGLFGRQNDEFKTKIKINCMLVNWMSEIATLKLKSFLQARLPSQVGVLDAKPRSC